MKEFCYNCEEIHEVELKTITDNFEVRDIEVEATINTYVCKNCGQETYVRENEIKNDIIIFDAYKKAKGLLTSVEIKSIREKYGLTQSQFARLIGVGEKTITRYENGSIQDIVYDNIIRLTEKPENFIELWLKIRKDNINIEKKVINKFIKNDNNSCDINFERHNNYKFKENCSYNICSLNTAEVF